MQEPIPHEAALTTTLKADGKDAPWIVIRSRDASQLQSQLRELEHGSAFTDLGRVQERMRSSIRMGSKLDAAPLAPQPSSDEAWQTPTGQGASAPQNSSAGAPATQPQSAAPAGQPSTGQGAPASAGNGQGQGMSPQFPGASNTGVQPVGQAGGQGYPAQGQWDGQPAAPQAPVAQPPAAPQGFQQPPAAPAAPQQAAQQGSPMARQEMPGAPIILGRPAVFQSGSSSRGPWSAMFDPRPQAELEQIPRDANGKVPETDDENHPGLAGGTHKFVRFLR